MIRPLLVCCLAMAVCAAGCAGLNVTAIGTDSAKDKAARGFRYYQSAPFLLVSTDNKGGLASQILYLPDTTKKMSIQPYSYGATNESTLKFENGVLTQATVQVDETVIPKAALDALKDVLAAAAKAAAFNIVGAEQTTAPAPSLYKIIVQGDQILLVGGQGTGPDGGTTIKTSVRIGQ